MLVARSEDKLQRLKQTLEDRHPITATVIAEDLAEPEAAKRIFDRTQAVYYATKAYVTSFAQAIANEVAEHKITATALCPGAVATGFVEAGNLEGVEVWRCGGVEAWRCGNMPNLPSPSTDAVTGPWKKAS